MNHRVIQILDLINWGQDFVADCSGVSENVIERNNAWWKKYSDKIQKFKNRMETKAECWTEAECGCYAQDEEIPIAADKCLLHLGTFPDVNGKWKFSFDLKINSLPTDSDPVYNSLWDGGRDFISGIGSSKLYIQHLCDFCENLFMKMENFL